MVNQAILKALPEELASKLPKTVYTARYDEALDPCKNLLWCSTFQLAWDALGRDVLGGDPRLEGAPELEAGLNRHLAGARELDDASYVAMAGFGKDGVLEKIQAALAKRFGDEVDSSLLPDSLGPNDILAYAYLFKNLLFETHFHDLGSKYFFIPRQAIPPRVEAFGLDPSLATDADGSMARCRRQVTIHHYASNEDFAVELHTKGKEDRLLFARLTPLPTLKKTVAAALERFDHGKCDRPRLEEDESLSIPKMDFDLTRNFPEIEGRKLLNSGFEAYFVSKALQNIRFRLNEKGVLLKSEAAMDLALGLPEVLPRTFNLCAPHLLLLMRANGTEPYFALWVGNEELLVPGDDALSVSGSRPTVSPPAI